MAHIWICSRNHIFSHSLSRALHERGHWVERLEGGSAQIGGLERLLPDVVVLDSRDGPAAVYACYRRISASSHGTRAVLVSSDSVAAVGSALKEIAAAAGTGRTKAAASFQ